MIRGLFALSLLMLVAAPAAAGQVRYYSFDPADDRTQRLTRGITLEVERGLFGGVRVHGLYSTSARGSADLDHVGGLNLSAALPAGARESNVYRILPDGDGRALGRALCAGSDEAYLVMGRVRLGDPLTVHAVGRTGEGAPQLCATLQYEFRGEWALPPRDGPDPSDSLAPRLGR